MSISIETSKEEQCESTGFLKFELTVFRNDDGRLSKQVALVDGMLIKTPAATLVRGRAKRILCNSMADLGNLIQTMLPSEAIALGVLNDDLADNVSVVAEPALPTKRPPTLIARTRNFLKYRANTPALVLLDFDTNQMPENVKQRIDANGFIATLREVIPELRDAAHVIRSSTSAGIYNADTDEQYEKSSGLHLYILARDGADAKRFLKTLLQRCALHGLAWPIITKNGSLLQRSIIDASVYGPERLCFEGPPYLQPPLAQDGKARQPIAVEGSLLDTRSACPDLTPAEKLKVAAFWSAEAKLLDPEACQQREIYIRELAAQRGVMLERARVIVAGQHRGVLTHDAVLNFPGIGRVTVAEVCSNESRFIGQTVIDPVDESGDRAKIYKRTRTDGRLCINSFHHGGGTFVLEPEPSAPEPGAPEVPKPPALWCSDEPWIETDIPPRPWIAPGFFLRGTVTMLAGPPSAMKSLMSLTWGAALALGQQHGRFVPAQAGKALIFNIEDSDVEQRRRLSAILGHFGAKPEGLLGKLFRAGPTGVGTLFFADKDKGGIAATDTYTQLIDAIETIRPDVLIVDPFSELHTFDENANTEIRLVIAQLRKLAERYQMAVCVLHHTRKGSANSAGDTDTARGASSIIGACRIVLTLMPMSDDDAKNFGMPRDAKSRTRYARLDDAKSNYSAIREPCWYEKAFITLSNGEGAIVPKSWFPPVQRTINDDSIKEVIDGVKRGIQTDKGVQPYSPKRDDKEERSIRKLLAMHGFTPGQESSVMMALEELGMETLKFKTPARNDRMGLRMEGLPVANWAKPYEQTDF